MATQKQQPAKGSIRDRPGNSGSEFFTLRRGVRDFAVVILVFNILNILLYNTGWIDWKNDNFDVIWATGLCALDIAVVVMFQLMDK